MCSLCYNQENAQLDRLEEVKEERGRQVGVRRKVSFKVLVLSTISFLWNLPQFLIRFFQRGIVRFSNLVGKHTINDRIITYSASIFFIKKPKSSASLCLKMWRFRDDSVYDATSVEQCTRYILDGLQLNRRFAPDICLGVARIECLNEQYIVIEDFIEQPELENLLLSGKEHALVMKRLPDKWRLDIQLDQGLLDTQETLKFLAREVARLHKMVEKSPLMEMGSVKALGKKLQANVVLLNHIDCIQNQHEKNKRITDTLLSAYEENKEGFEERWREGHIRHCHGDLKPSNLWLRPPHWLQSQRLLALDCVDFNRPEFCHIDTLSDIAMLAIHLEFSFMRRLGRKKGQKLLRYFLTTYLDYAGEDHEQALPLLEYYMAEKAIVCAYTSYVYDSLQLAVVDRYLKLVLAHAEKLETYRVPTSSLKKNLLQRRPSTKKSAVSQPARIYSR